MPKNHWTRDELILTFNLYLKLPFGKMHKQNPQVIELAKLTGRTPSSIGMRLGNFASCDPLLKSRGISGLQGGLNQVQPIWDEFYQNQEELVYQSEQILAKYQNTTLEEKYKEYQSNQDFIEGKTATYQIKTRVNQAVFRTMVLNNYETKCSITGINNVQLLVASHIIPWSEDKKNRLNPQNGLCLNALHDKAFDKGLITITPNYHVKLSPFLKESNTETINLFLPFENKTIILPDTFKPNPEFLEYHNNNIFQH